MTQKKYRQYNDSSRRGSIIHTPQNKIFTNNLKIYAHTTQTYKIGNENMKETSGINGW